MNCEQLREAWHLADEEAPPSEELALHIRECESCRQYVRDLGRIAAALAELRAESEVIGSHRDFVPATPRQQWGTVARLAAAIGIIVGLGSVYWALPPRYSLVREPRATITTSAEPTRNGFASESAAQPALGITLNGRSAKELLAIAAPPSNPDVQLYWLYPLLRNAETVSP